MTVCYGVDDPPFRKKYKSKGAIQSGLYGSFAV